LEGKKKGLTGSLSFSALQTKPNFAILKFKSKSLDRSELSVWNKAAELEEHPGVYVVTELKDGN